MEKLGHRFGWLQQAPSDMPPEQDRPPGTTGHQYLFRDRRIHNESSGPPRIGRVRLVKQHVIEAHGIIEFVGALSPSVSNFDY